MDKYEIIGKDVWGVKAKNLTNVTNCSECRYNGYSCLAVDCGEFFYLKDEEIEKLENKKSYKVIEKNEYGVKVKNTTGYWDCYLCNYDKKSCGLDMSKCNFKQYYLPDSEAEKLESEKQKPLADEIIIIQKDKIKMLEDTLEKVIETLKEYLFVESNTSLLIDPNKINTSVFQFHKNGNVILEFKANGDIFIKGELVENNIDVVNLLKDICNGKYVQQTDSDTQKEIIDLRVELRVEKEKSKALEEYSRGLELQISNLKRSIDKLTD